MYIKKKKEEFTIPWEITKLLVLDPNYFGRGGGTFVEAIEEIIDNEVVREKYQI